MKLDRFGTRLDDYLEGSASADDKREIEDFVASSAVARRELAHYRRLIESLAELPDSIEPERDLFPAIAARLNDDNARCRPRPWRPALLAAMLAAGLGLAWWTTRATTTAADQPPAAAHQAAVTATSRAEDDLVAATRQLEAALAANREALPPETRRLIEHNLEIIRSAIGEIQIALERDPGNQELNRALVAYYQHELALLEQVNRAASRL